MMMTWCVVLLLTKYQALDMWLLAPAPHHSLTKVELSDGDLVDPIRAARSTLNRAWKTRVWERRRTKMLRQEAPFDTVKFKNFVSVAGPDLHRKPLWSGAEYLLQTHGAKHALALFQLRVQSSLLAAHQTGAGEEDGDIDPRRLTHALDYFSADQPLFDQKVLTDSANWKLLYETLMEGYHIKSLHRESFYPFGYDNLNVVETFGPHSRVVYPFQRIEQLREVPPSDRNLSGLVTSVYMLFPNASISVLSKHTNLVILEPVSPTESQWVIYSLINTSSDGKPFDLEDAKRDAAFVNDSGQEEDRAAAAAIQRTLASGANSHLTFGHFEKAIVHFHQRLAEYL